MVAVNKPAGHLVHPADRPAEDDQVVMKNLRDQLGQRVDPIHRLDRPTTGVLLFGLTSYATKKLRKVFDARLVTKTYWAICKGSLPTESQWFCDMPLRKDESAPLKDALTTFRFLQSFAPPCANIPFLHLIEATPSTGRFHQIRRHLASAKLPIVGDYRYMGMDEAGAVDRELDLNQRMLLQAQQLTLPHPTQQHNVTICAPVDPYFSKILPTLKG